MTAPRPETRTRLLTALVLVPLFVLAIWLGRVYLLATVAALSGIAAREFYGLARAKLYRARTAPGVALAVAIPIVLYLGAIGRSGHLVGLLALGILAIGVLQLLDPDGEEAIAAVAVTVFGAAYAGLFLGHMVLLRELPARVAGLAYRDGALLLAIPIFLTWANDTAAYFVGHRWGRRKLLPRVSPGKSVEGALGALLATIALAVPLVWAVAGRTGLALGPVDGLAIGALVGLAAPAGDLLESAFKRDAGVKDASGLIPGHGGVLDRFDSTFVTVPAFYWYVRAVVL